MMKFRYYAVKLCILMIVLFLIQAIFPLFTDYFILNSNSFKEPWRFISSIFLHASLIHLILNLFALFLFGNLLEKFIGGKRFLFVFFFSGIFANLIAVNFYGASLGASGAIFGVIGALMLIRPMMVVWAFNLPMPMFVAGILWAAGDILGAYGFFTNNPINNTGNIAHLSGLLIGLIFGYFYRKFFREGTKKMNVSLDENQVRVWEDRYLR